MRCRGNPKGEVQMSPSSWYFMGGDELSTESQSGIHVLKGNIRRLCMSIMRWCSGV